MLRNGCNVGPTIAENLFALVYRFLGNEPE